MVSGLFRSVKCSAMTFVREGRFASPASNRSIGIVEIVDEGKPESHRPKLPHHARAGSGDTGMTIGCSRIDRASASPSRYMVQVGTTPRTRVGADRRCCPKWRPSYAGEVAVNRRRCRFRRTCKDCQQSRPLSQFSSDQRHAVLPRPLQTVSSCTGTRQRQL